MDGTIIGQGTFLANALVNPNPGNVATGVGIPQIIQIPSGADWIVVRDWSAAGANGSNTIYLGGAATATTGVEWYWQLGMAPNTAIVKYKANGSAALSEDVITGGGFQLYAPAGQFPAAQPFLGPPIALTNVSNAITPVVTTASTAGLTVGMIVRLAATVSPSLNGIDFVIGSIVSGTTFRLLTAGSNALANIPGAGGASTGTFRVVNQYPLYYPRSLVVTNISQAVNAQVSTTKPHGLTVGQEVRFNIPKVSGMVQLNPNQSIFLNPWIIESIVDDNTFTINANTTNFTAFTYPTAAQSPSSFPVVIPFGEDTATSLASNTAQVPSIAGIQIPNTNTQVLADSVVNTGFLGMILGSGGLGTALGTNITGPSGTVTWSAGNAITEQDVMYWVAGKSTYGGQ